MDYKQNLHTHTNFADGLDSPEEMVKAAIEKGFSSIGFSEHSPMYYSPSPGMSVEDLGTYKNEINRLRKKYQSEIDIFCGVEYDMYSDIPLDGFDYTIGDVHYFKIDGEFVGFDRDAKTVRAIIQKYFDNDGMKYVKAYYEAMSELPNYGNFDIIGHFDLITKHMEKECLFDESSEQYKEYAFNAIAKLKGKIPFFEVNTGAIARGYRTTAYPSADLIKEFKKNGFGAVITSDCHDSKKLNCEFEQAEAVLRQCGFKEIYILTNDGFKTEEI